MDDGFEERLERGLKTAGLFAGPVAGLLLYSLNPGGHAEPGRRLLAVLALAICWWITEAIPLPATALLAAALASILGVAPARQVMAPFADPVIFLFIGSFLLSEAFQKYGLDRRVAALALHPRSFGRSPRGLVAGFGTAAALVSTCLSNTATAALFTPMVTGTIEARGEGTSRRPTALATAMLLMVAYGASLGGMATVIGTPPNLLVAGYLERLVGVRVTFVGWLVFGLPIAAVLFLLSLAFTRWALGSYGTVAGGEPPAEPALSPDRAADRRTGARWTMAAFGTAFLLWMAPSLAGGALGRDHAVTKALNASLPEAAVAVLCAALLFVAPLRWKPRRFALDWSDGQRVNWGIILLFGGGLSLGTMAEATGLAKWAGEGVVRLGLAGSPEGFLLLVVVAGIVVSEFASNTASATLLVPVVIAAAQASGFDPVRPALAAGLAATCGFVFPVSTPPNAIVFGTGLVPLSRMIRAGILLDLASVVVIWAGMLLLTPILPR